MNGIPGNIWGGVVGNGLVSAIGGGQLLTIERTASTLILEGWERGPHATEQRCGCEGCVAMGLPAAPTSATVAG